MTLADVNLGDPHVAAHNDERHAHNDLDAATAKKAANLSDLVDPAAARGNLGLGSAAVQPSTAFATAAQGSKADTAMQPATHFLYSPEERRYYGPNTSDISGITYGDASDAAFNESYAIANNTLPNPWPVDVFGVASVSSNTYSTKTSQTGTGTVGTYRVMCDADQLRFFTYGPPYVIDVFVDGKPYANNPISPAISTGYSPYGWQTITFTSAKPRLIEFRMLAGLVALYVKKPYRCWKPPKDLNPGIAVVGDSWVLPTIMSDTVAGNAAGDTYLPGIYQRMAALLGLSKLTTDGIGGTGYLAGGGPSMPYSHATRKTWVQNVGPDVLIVHGGGVNDLYNNANTVAATQDAMVTYFTDMHALLPNAKLVFVEGMYIPLAGFSSHVADLITLRQNVQSALNAAGVPVYYLDVVTTRAPINGTGYVTAANASGNSDIYIGSDQAHPTVRGHQYIRHFLAPKIAKVLADDGTLVGSLIT